MKEGDIVIGVPTGRLRLNRKPYMEVREEGKGDAVQGKEGRGEVVRDEKGENGTIYGEKEVLQPES